MGTTRWKAAASIVVSCELLLSMLALRMKQERLGAEGVLRAGEVVLDVTHKAVCVPLPLPSGNL